MKFICALEELSCPGSKSFELNGESLFLVRTKEEITAFKNQCPHTGAPLNWQPDQFFDYDQKYIQCALHMALFEPNTGKCIWGPCKGDSLIKQAMIIKNGAVYLEEK